MDKLTQLQKNLDEFKNLINQLLVVDTDIVRNRMILNIYEEKIFQPFKELLKELGCLKDGLPITLDKRG